MTPPRSDVEVLRTMLAEIDGQAETLMANTASIAPRLEIRGAALRAAIEVMEGKGWRPMDTLPEDSVSHPLRRRSG